MYPLLDQYFGGIIKRYLLFIGIGTPLSLIVGLWVFPMFSGKSGNSVPVENEKVYNVPERSEIRTDQQTAKESVSSPQPEQGQEGSPPQKNPNLEKINRLREIEAQFIKPQSTRDPTKILELLALQEEMLKLQQELGILNVEGGDPFLSNKIGQLVLSNMTNDNRLPVSVGEEMVDVLVEGGDIDGAATIYMATQRAMENGDEFFTPEHWTEWETSEQGGSEHSAVTIDPCCPDETTQAPFEDGHGHSTPTNPPITTQTAKNVKAELSEELSLERFDKGRQLIDEYGLEEGLRRLREIDPEAARRFEREDPSVSSREQGENREPSRDAPKGHTHPDGQSHDDSP